MAFWTLELQIRVEQVWSNPNRDNLIGVLFANACIWTGLLYFMQHVITHHNTNLVVLLVCAFVCGTCLTANFVINRREELYDFANLITFFCWQCAAFPITVIVHHVQNIIAAPKVWIRKVVVFQRPRYRQEHSGRILFSNSRTGRLCPACDTVIGRSALLTGTSWLITSPVERHRFKTFNGLADSAQYCHLCYLLLRSLQLPDNVATNRDALTVKIASVPRINDPDAIQIQLIDSGATESKALSVDELHISGGSSLDHQSTSTNTGDKPSMDLVKTWIAGCQKHTLCQRNNNFNMTNRFHPTRLLELTPGLTPNIRLVTVAMGLTESVEIFEYVALSHCWGRTDIPKLTEEGLAKFYTSIDFSLLPPTFQDAVKFTLGIGYKYLWIDSLCIMQNSTRDWDTEAPMMGQLFANAACTISATHSEGPHGGLFTAVELSNEDCIIRKDNNFSLLVRSGSLEEAALADLFETKVERAPVAKRGWIFQERVLSKRILHFSEGTLLFECNTMRASKYHKSGVFYSKRANIRADGRMHSSAVVQRLRTEDQIFTRVIKEEIRQGTSTRPISRPPKPYVFKKVLVSKNLDFQSQKAKMEKLLDLSALQGMRGAFQLLLRSSGKDLSEKMEFHACWYEILEQYSTRLLTKHTDKLMAVAGIADFIQLRALDNRKFLAGLWSDILPFNLLWMREEDYPMATRPSRDLPTWSWASVDGRISHKLKEILPKEDRNNSPARTHSVEEAFHTHWEQIQPLIDNDRIEYEPLLERNGLVHNAILKLFGLILPFDEYLVQTNMDTRVDYRPAFLMPILAFKNVHVPPIHNGIQVHGLVLCEHIGRSSGTFERKGYFWSTSPDVTARLTIEKGQWRRILLV